MYTERRLNRIIIIIIIIIIITCYIATTSAVYNRKSFLRYL